jgi:hypothetical protein
MVPVLSKPSSLIIDSISLFLKIIWVKVQPDIALLMILGGDLTRYGPIG